MDLNFFKSTGFRIKELKISAKDGIEYDISGLYEELNIFDSIVQPCITGNIIIKDSVGLTDSLFFDGNEFLLMNIGKTEGDELDIKRVFRIYKQTNRNIINQNTEKYVLHFVSEEFIQSKVTRVSQAYESTLSEIAIRILKDYLKAPSNKLINGKFDSSLGVKSVVIPNWHPIESLIWLSKIAIDEDMVPGFLFFENLFGYNFVSLSSLLKQKSVVNINFDPKNLNVSDELRNFLGARYFEVLQQFDLIKNIENGVYGGKFQGYDPGTHSFLERLFKHDDIRHPKNPENPAPSVGNIRTSDGSTMTDHFNASLSYGTTNLLSSLSDNINENDPEAMQKRFDYENSLFQRKSIFAYLFSQRVKLVVPGNFALSSGSNIYLNIPKYSKKISDEDNLDKTLFGSYLIISSRHILTPDNKHETIFEACTNSSNRNEKNVMYTRSSYVSGDYNA